MSNLGLSGPVNGALPLFKTADFTFNEVLQVVEALIHAIEPGVDVAPEIVDAGVIEDDPQQDRNADQCSRPPVREPSTIHSSFDGLICCPTRPVALTDPEE
jgi:hypothetical protein